MGGSISDNLSTRERLYLSSSQTPAYYRDGKITRCRYAQRLLESKKLH